MSSAAHASFTQPIPKQHFSTPPRLLFIGAGSRGNAYAKAARSCSNAVIAAVCDIDAFKTREFGRKFIWREQGEAEPGMQFGDWKEWVAYETERRRREADGEEVEKGVDAVFVCVRDELHEEVVCGIADLEVHICCEKPLATTWEACLRMYAALKGLDMPGSANGVAQANGHAERKKRKERVFGICHVLRYSAHNMLLRKLLLEDRVVGEVLSVEHVEPVGWWHFSHSYVRGNWRNESTTAPSLLTKSCHDIDFLMWLLCSPPPTAPPETKPHLPSKITSTGNLTFFRKQHKPAAAGAATNCLSCPIEPTCIYSAKKLYLTRHLARGKLGWPVKIVVPEIEDIYRTSGRTAAKKRLLDALSDDYGPVGSETVSKEEVQQRNWFGRCVWEADNDVCDDQVVTITWDDEERPEAEAGAGAELSNGSAGAAAMPLRMAKSATFHMVAFSQAICQRRGTIYGTTGEVKYDSDTIRVHSFVTGQTDVHKPHHEGGGHGGGDAGLVRKFLAAVNTVDHEGCDVGKAQRKWLGVDLEEVIRSHGAVWAAEEGRRTGETVDWGRWWRENGGGIMRE